MDPVPDHNFLEILTSPIFTFVVGSGEEKKTVPVHSTAIIKHSDVLKALMTGGMNESQNRIAYLEDTSPETFCRFVEFAYVLEYTCPTYELEELPEDPHKEHHPDHPLFPEKAPEFSSRKRSTFVYPELDDVDNFEDGFDDEDLDKPTGELKRNNSTQEDIYADQEDLLIVDKTQQLVMGCSKTNFCLATFWPHLDVALAEYNRMSCGNESCLQNFTPVFIGHAELYVFADRYQIPSLKQLTLYKIHETLKKLILLPQRVKDVLALVKFAYSDENTADMDSERDDLRSLVICYVACRSNVICKTEEFGTLMEEGGAFARDFTSVIVGKLACKMPIRCSRTSA